MKQGQIAVRSCGKTIEQVAHEARVSVEVIGKYARGERHCPTTALRIARVVGGKMEWFLPTFVKVSGKSNLPERDESQSVQKQAAD